MMINKPATPELEAFYKEALTLVAACARKHGDTASVHDMIAVLSKGVGLMICACYPNERDLARATAIENIDFAVAHHASGEPSSMNKQ